MPHGLIFQLRNIKANANMIGQLLHPITGNGVPKLDFNDLFVFYFNVLSNFGILRVLQYFRRLSYLKIFKDIQEPFFR